jgi:hypothetical protein
VVDAMLILSKTALMEMLQMENADQVDGAG